MNVIFKIHSIYELQAVSYRKGMTASEIAGKLGIPRSSCYRLLGEMNRGINALATPVFGKNSLVIGAISLVGTEESLPVDTLKHYSEDFIDASIDISATLGGKYPD